LGRKFGLKKACFWAILGRPKSNVCLRAIFSGIGHFGDLDKRFGEIGHFRDFGEFWPLRTPINIGFSQKGVFGLLITRI